MSEKVSDREHTSMLLCDSRWKDVKGRYGVLRSVCATLWGLPSTDKLHPVAAAAAAGTSPDRDSARVLRAVVQDIDGTYRMGCMVWRASA